MTRRQNRVRLYSDCFKHLNNPFHCQSHTHVNGLRLIIGNKKTSPICVLSMSQNVKRNIIYAADPTPTTWQISLATGYPYLADSPILAILAFRALGLKKSKADEQLWIRSPGLLVVTDDLPKQSSPPSPFFPPFRFLSPNPFGEFLRRVRFPLSLPPLYCILDSSSYFSSVVMLLFSPPLLLSLSAQTHKQQSRMNHYTFSSLHIKTGNERIAPVQFLIHLLSVSGRRY